MTYFVEIEQSGPLKYGIFHLPYIRILILRNGEGAITVVEKKWGQPDLILKSGTLDQSDIESIKAEIEKCGFWEMKDKYEGEVSDGGHSSIAINIDGKSKQVEEFQTSERDRSRGYKDLFSFIENLVNSKIDRVVAFQEVKNS